MSHQFQSLLYLIASVFFILSLRGLSGPKTARQGNVFGMIGMVIAIGATLFSSSVANMSLILGGLVIGGTIGTVIAKRIAMTALPQLVAAFHSLVGLSAVGVAAAALLSPAAFGIGFIGHIQTSSLIEMVIGAAIGAVTFTGSIIAFCKLQGIISGKPLTFAMQHFLNLGLGLVIIFLCYLFVNSGSVEIFSLIVLISFILGILLIMPIGGADMPVIVSMLNSYSGWAAVGIGFTLNNHLLIITGALVGSSGAILSYVMCKGMNRSLFNVILGGFGGTAVENTNAQLTDRTFKSGNAEDAAYILSESSSVIIVPGYGMAVAQAQHALREMGNILRAKGINVRYAIHPVAGRMPGHMNVLLAEANVPYEDVLELDDINRDFSQTDVAFVIGANDVTNPAAKTDPTSSIYGMPILDVINAKTILFVKRSMSPGYAGVENELFFKDNTLMLFGDAKKMCEEIVKALEH